jgi:hypothetical protein
VTRGRIGSALAGVLVGSPALGGDEGAKLSGKAELLATYLHLDDEGKAVIQGGEATDYWTLGGGGALDVAWRALNLQADFSAEGTLGEKSADDTYQHSYGGGLHVGWRNPERGSFAGFGSVGNVKINNEENRKNRLRSSRDVR